MSSLFRVEVALTPLKSSDPQVVRQFFFASSDEASRFIGTMLRKHPELMQGKPTKWPVRATTPEDAIEEIKKVT